METRERGRRTLARRKRRCSPAAAHFIEGEGCCRGPFLGASEACPGAYQGAYQGACQEACREEASCRVETCQGAAFLEEPYRGGTFLEGAACLEETCREELREEVRLRIRGERQAYLVPSS